MILQALWISAVFYNIFKFPLLYQKTCKPLIQAGFLPLKLRGVGDRVSHPPCPNYQAGLPDLSGGSACLIGCVIPLPGVHSRAPEISFLYAGNSIPGRHKVYSLVIRSIYPERTKDIYGTDGVHLWDTESIFRVSSEYISKSRGVYYFVKRSIFLC